MSMGCGGETSVAAKAGRKSVAPSNGRRGRAMGMGSMMGAVETEGTCGAGARLMGKVVAKAATSPAEAMAGGTTSLSMGICPDGGGCLRNEAGAGLPPAGSAMGMVVASAACLPRHHCWDIWASISSIFLSVTARSPEDLELSRLLRNCEPCAAGPGTPTGALPGLEACCSSAWRRRRSWSNSRLRTKSLRRLRSIISLSACLLYWLSCSPSRPSRSDQLTVGWRTKRTTLDNNPPDLLLSSFAMASQISTDGLQAVAATQSPYIFCLSSRRCWASSDSVAVGRASRRPTPMGSPVSSQ